MEKENRRGLGFIGGLLAGVVMTSVLVVAGYFVGQSMKEQNLVEQEQSSLASGVAGQEQSSLASNADRGMNGIVNVEFVQKVNTIEAMIKKLYYLDEVDADVLREGAYDGIVAALGDVYSVYYTPEETEEIFAETEGVYYGIGAYVQMDTVTGYVKITGTIKNTPAEEAGLQAGDILYKVNGEDMAGLDTTQVVMLIKGEEGTTVHLTLVRGNEYVEVDVERRKIETPSVEYKMLDDRMGYIQLAEFNDSSVTQFSGALSALESEKAEGLILDLRGNPGGNLDAVVSIADMLLGDGMILYTEDKYGNGDVYMSDAEEELEIPLVVLVDMNSASAAEVLSGALKDHDKATLVGTTTFGKGIVQTIRTMLDGSAVKLTVSAYYTPSGANIHEIGIEPDVMVEFDGEAYVADGYDNQLEKAKEVLAGMLP